MTTVSKLEKRILTFCRTHGGGRTMVFDSEEGQYLLTGGQGPAGPQLLATAATLNMLVRSELLQWKNDIVSLTPLGLAALKRAGSAADEQFLQQHRSVSAERIQTPQGWETVTVNQNESPLTRMRARIAADGRRWISDSGFAAGETLRRDFEFGNLRQNVSSNWSFDGGAGRSSVNGGKADLGDNALDARKRLENAVTFLGPDLAGVVMDVCCFLKGLESIERERRWPPRSAKLMLRTGLDLLAAYYGTRAGAPHHRARKRASS